MSKFRQKSSEGTLENRRILVTGANGFIGRNLVVRLRELDRFSVVSFVRDDAPKLLPQLLLQVDAVVHLAGENRPTDSDAFTEVNVELTRILCDSIRNAHTALGRRIPLLLTSSIQAELDNHYGRSKLLAEQAAVQLAEDIGNDVRIFRLPGVFGKWCKPNYNSVVATFCHALARKLPLQIHDPSTVVRLVYIDDLVSTFIDVLSKPKSGFSFERVQPEYILTLGQLADQIRFFDACRTSLMIAPVGTALARALYATYVSHFPSEKFSYEVPNHSDDRGDFVEMLKTPDSGQFSYFTIYPGVTRGGHYHHTKTEKFLVIRGEALFRYRHILTNEFVELRTSGSLPQVVDSIPGWSHDITNVGNSEVVVMLWANENFDREYPDTVASQVEL